MDLSRRDALRSLCGALVAMPVLGCRGATEQQVTPRSDERVAAFLRAVQEDRLDEVARDLAQDPGLATAVDAQGRSAYVLARLADAKDVAARLLEEDFELDLIEAVLAEDWTRVEALAAGEPGSLAAAHPIGGGALYAAARCGVGELYRLRALGCDPDDPGRPGRGFTPPRAATECRDPLGASYALTELLSNGSSVNAPQVDGSSVLHGAVHSRRSDLVRLVVRKGGDVRARNARGQTPLDLARELGWAEGVALLEAEADLVRDHRSSRFAYDLSRAPVTFADLSDVPQAEQSKVTGLSHGNFDAVRKLLEEDPHKAFSISTDDELAIEACAHTGNRRVIQLHLDHGAPYSLPTAISMGDGEFARFLLDDDPARIHERGAHDFALMWYAAIGGDQVELAELLLERGVAVDQASLGTTALHWCARRNRPRLARRLVDAGADVHAVGRFFERAGQTPLAVARNGGHSEVVDVLLYAGATH